MGTANFQNNLKLKNKEMANYDPGTDFPYFLLTILASSIFASAVSMSGLFPYVGFMVVDMGLVDDINRAGYYAGYIASSFMFGRIFSSYIWGRIADRIGRKKVLLVGCVSIASISVLFGFSVNFTMALLSRALLGIFNPIIGIAKTVISEICPSKHEASGMGIVTSTWNLGLVVGPAVGGLLARPATQYPNLFGKYYILEIFPYLLPNIATAIISIISGILIHIYLPETLEINNINETDKKYSQISNDNNISEDEIVDEKEGIQLQIMDIESEEDSNKKLNNYRNDIEEKKELQPNEVEEKEEKCNT